MTATHKIEEKTLIDSYQEKPEQSLLAKLFLPYKNLVFGACLKYMKNTADAEDAVSGVYELVSRKLKTHKVENFKSWLYVVTKNYCFEELRKKSRKLTKEKEAADMYSQEVFHPDSVDKEEMLNRLETCIEKLEMQQQTCIQKFYFEKQSYHEIADGSDISWSKVRSYIQNGRRMIKKCMEA